MPKVRFEYYLAALDGPHGNDGAIAQLADAETRAADYQAQALKDLQEQSYLDAVASDAGDVQATCKTAMKDTLQVISDLSAKIKDDAVTAARESPEREAAGREERIRGG